MKSIMSFCFWVLVFVSGTALGADANGYTAKYECISGGANCNVDVATYTTASCAQTITTADTLTQINSKLNTGSSPICVTNGDYTAKGTVAITASGTSGAYRVMRYTRAGDTDDEPWNQSDGNKVKIDRMNVTGDYWIIHRITLPSNTSDGIVRFSIAANNNIINRVLLEGPGGSTACQGGFETLGSNNTIQNGIIRDLRSCTAGSPVGIQVSDGSNNLSIVNNEIYDWCEHPIQIGYNNIISLTNVVVENNDLYITPASIAPDGDAAMGWAISIKAIATSANPTKIIHNRIWNKRPQDGGVCGTPDSGHAIGWNANVGADNRYTIVQNNIITDSIGAFAGYEQTINQISIIGNLIYDTGPRGTDTNSVAVSFNSISASEVYLNTFINSRIGVNSDNGVFGEWGGQVNLDIRCNTIIDSDRSSTDTPASSTIMDYNVFYGSPIKTLNGTATNVDKTLSTRTNSTAYTAGQIMRTTATPPADGTAGDFIRVALNTGTSAGSPPTFCTRLNCQTLDNDIWWKAVRGPLVWKRKLMTVAGGETFYIPYARAKNDSDLPEFNSCPSNFADRTGIGINDATGFSSFSPDIRGVAR